MKDRDIILLLQNKPSDGLREAIKEYGELLKIIISRLIPHNPMDVEECVADTFVSAWKTISRLDSETASLKGYLLCIARNTAINRYHRLKKDGRSFPLDSEMPADDNVEFMILREETAVQLQELITIMPEPDRQIIIRKYYLFETIKEIALQLSMDEIQVKNRLYRSRQKLKKALEERGITLESLSR